MSTRRGDASSLFVSLSRLLLQLVNELKEPSVAGAECDGELLGIGPPLHVVSHAVTPRSIENGSYHGRDAPVQHQDRHTASKNANGPLHDNATLRGMAE